MARSRSPRSAGSSVATETLTGSASGPRWSSSTLRTRRLTGGRPGGQPWMAVVPPASARTCTYVSRDSGAPWSSVQAGHETERPYVGALGQSRWLGYGVIRLGSARSEEHTSELQSRLHLVCRLLLEKKKKAVPTTKTRTVLVIKTNHPPRHDTD